jgi:hypothetical protein
MGAEPGSGFCGGGAELVANPVAQGGLQIDAPPIRDAPAAVTTRSLSAQATQGKIQPAAFSSASRPGHSML